MNTGTDMETVIALAPCWAEGACAGRGIRLAGMAAPAARAADLLSGAQPGVRDADRRDWNVKQSGSGYVTRFRVRQSFLDRYEIHQVGGRTILEYWIPAEDLAELNANIVGLIEVVAEYHQDTRP